MRIGIDTRWIFPEISGIGAYTVALVRHLAALDRKNEYVLFLDDPAREAKLKAEMRLDNAHNVRTHMLPFGIFSFRGQVELPGLLEKLGLHVFHSPNYMIPLRAFPRRRGGRIRCVITLHDLIPLLFPQYTPRAMKTRMFPIFRKLMKEVVARADMILTVSESSRRDIERELGAGGAAGPEVRVVPNGVSTDYKPPATRKPRDGKTILYVGRFDPYKNVPGVIRAFAKVREWSKEPVRLRVIGARDERYPEAPKLATELGLDPWIEWSGYADGAALVQAYQQADVCVLLSKYEGFGLTVLESMACGTPVVCGNRSSLPEVAGDAALLADPDQPDEAARAIVKVLEDPAAAAELREKGLARARKFTWLRSAELTLKAFEDVVR